MKVKKSKHRYIFYFYPKFDLQTGEHKKGFFKVYEHSKEGKKDANKMQREYDYEKIF